MIIRNAATRHSRRTFVPTCQRCIRLLSTETTTVEAPLESELNGMVVQNKPNELKLHQNLMTPSRRTKKKVDIRPWKEFSLLKHNEKHTGDLGSIVEPHYEPHDLIANPPSPKDVTLELLLASQAHLGHATRVWNPMNQRYIYGIRQGIHIISLEQTAAHLRRAAKVVEGVAYHGGLILFVGKKKHAECVVKAAEMAKGCHLYEMWKPGAITNGRQILGPLAKRVLGPNDEEVEGFDKQLEEWPPIKPDLVVTLNTMDNYVLLHECGLYNIPTIGIVDTNADPTWVTYPIPANDDSLRCVQLIAGVLGRAGEEGQKKRLEAAKKGKITWEPPPLLGAPKTKDGKKQVEAETPEEAEEDSELEVILRAKKSEVEEIKEPVKDLLEDQGSIKRVEDFPPVVRPVGGPYVRVDEDQYPKYESMEQRFTMEEDQLDENIDRAIEDILAGEKDTTEDGQMTEEDKLARAKEIKALLEDRRLSDHPRSLDDENLKFFEDLERDLEIDTGNFIDAERVLEDEEYDNSMLQKFLEKSGGETPDDTNVPTSFMEDNEDDEDGEDNDTQLPQDFEKIAQELKELAGKPDSIDEASDRAGQEPGECVDSGVDVSGEKDEK